MKIWTPCDCHNKINSYLARVWYSQKRKKLPPPATSLILCDCEKVYQLQADGDRWVEVGVDTWASVARSSFAASSASS